MAHVYGRWGRRTDAESLLQDVVKSGEASPYLLAGVHAALDQPDLAFDWLNRSFEQHEVHLVSLKVDPSLDGLRHDARFDELTRRVGLPSD